MCGFALYDIPNVTIVGYDVVSQPAEGRGLPRAGRADRGLRAPRACIDELAREARASTRSQLRDEERARKDGTKAALRPDLVRTSATSRRWRRRKATRT